MKRDGRIAVESEVQREPEKIVFRNQLPVTPGKPFGKIAFQFSDQFLFGHRTRIKTAERDPPSAVPCFSKTNPYNAAIHPYVSGSSAYWIARSRWYNFSLHLPGLPSL